MEAYEHTTLSLYHIHDLGHCCQTLQQGFQREKKIVSVVSKIISTLFYLYHSMTRRRLKNCLMFFLSFYKEGLSNNELYFTTSDCRFSALLLGKIATIFLDKQTISTVRLELFKEANFCSAWQHCKSSLLSKFDKRRKTSGL